MTTKILSRLSEYIYFPQWRFAQYQLNQKAKTTNAFICRGNIQLTFADNCIIHQPQNPCFIGQYWGATPRSLITTVSLASSSHLMIDGVSILRGVNLSVGESASLKIGVGTYIAWRSNIYSNNSISIGKNCAISFDVIVMDDDGHGFGAPPYSAPIAIEDDVWIGCRATILKGVTIGKGSVVAAGAVVTKSCPHHSLIGGIPAKIIREGVVWTDELRISASQSINI
jgi:serine acetyltransferase